MSVARKPHRRLGQAAAPSPERGLGRGPHRRLESWLWTGPAGHLIGGALDFAQALARYALAQRRRRTGAQL